MDLKEEYKNLYEILIINVAEIVELPYNIENAGLQIEYAKLAMEALKQYSKFA